MKKYIFFICIGLLSLLFLFPGCKKYRLNKIQHRWQFIEIPVTDDIQIWSFDTQGKVHLIKPNGTTEDTAAVGTYEVVFGNRVRIQGFAASYNATWDIAKNNEEVMILSTKDLGGVTTREFLNLDTQ